MLTATPTSCWALTSPRPQPSASPQLCEVPDHAADPKGRKQDPWPLVPAHHIQLIQELIDPGVIIVTLGSHKVQGPAVLSADLLHQIIRNLLCLGRQTKESQAAELQRVKHGAIT